MLIGGVNWLGDSVMTLPALAVFRAAAPEAEMVMLVKSGLAAFWSLYPSLVDRVSILEEGARGTAATVRRLRREGFARAVVLPHSFRSALIPWLAGIPERVGMPGHWRDWMLTRRVAAVSYRPPRHQAFEYFAPLGVAGGDLPLRLPAAEVPRDVREAMDAKLRAGLPDGGRLAGRLVGIVPGAARGPAKRWPVDRFREVARRLATEAGCAVAVFGTAGERPLCAPVAAAAGAWGLDLSGKTSLVELAGGLARCRAVVSNDSGGMHLAAAMGARCVAVFGATDPVRTGPLGEGHAVLAAPGVRRSREIARTSGAAENALARVGTEEVFAACLGVLGSPRQE